MQANLFHQNTTKDAILAIQLVNSLPESPIELGQYQFDKAKVNVGNHTIHKYPAKYIPQFPSWALKYAKCTSRSLVLDPFCGSGTSLVEAGLLGCTSVGVDISPLAILITKAKTSTGRFDETDIKDFIKSVLQAADSERADIFNELSLSIGKEYKGMHRTWSNWFRPNELSCLLALRRAIHSTDADNEIKILALVCLSSILKASSYLSEDQIKVRFEHGKVLKDPMVTFPKYFLEQADIQREISKKYRNAKANFQVELGSAVKLPYQVGKVDLIVTSPPYINAVDYTMTHKYNLFTLGLIEPSNFWLHNHDYIGVTERAVKSTHLTSKPVSTLSIIDTEVSHLWEMDNPSAKNRAFVVGQYFNGMYQSFQEMYRVLKSTGKVVFVVGETNTICGHTIQTANILKEIAKEAGLITELKFYHIIANRSSMRLNRGNGGNEIKREAVLVFRKA